MKNRADVPTRKELMWPTVRALDNLGGSATISEIEGEVAKLMELGDEILDIPHTQGNRTSFEYRCAWARTYAKAAGAIDNSGRGVWILTPYGRSIQDEDSLIEEAFRAIRDRRGASKADDEVIDDLDGAPAEPEVAWRDRLLALLKEMDPTAFERLCQRVLRESGFTEVEVTGKSGDGGIDGAGILRVGLISFHVRFQCKRYKDAVSSPVIRDFRGAFVGRADKGLIITTGRFTADARREAVRDGAPAIDLIDGDDLCRLLKSLELGVTTRTVEEVTVEPAFFAAI